MRYAVKCIIKKDNKYLILHKSNLEDVTPNTWDLPGGGIDKNENPEQTAIREVKEETNLNVEIIKKIKEKTVNPKPRLTLHVTFFLCKYLSGEVKLSHEHNNYKWITKQEPFNSWVMEVIKMV